MNVDALIAAVREETKEEDAVICAQRGTSEAVMLGDMIRASVTVKG